MLYSNAVVASRTVPSEEIKVEYPEPVVEKPMDVLGLIRYYAEEYGADVDLAEAIAQCESKLNPTAKNPISGAGGIFQWLASSWKKNCEGDRFNAEDNIACGVKFIAEKQLHHWTADPRAVACWFPLYKKKVLTGK